MGCTNFNKVVDTVANFGILAKVVVFAYITYSTAIDFNKNLMKKLCNILPNREMFPSTAKC